MWACRRQVQPDERLAVDARGRAGGGVRVRVVGDVVAGHDDRGVGLADDDGDRAAVVVVVAGHVGEGPVGRAARDVRERGAQVEAGEGLGEDAGGGAGGAVRVAVVDAGVAGDADRRVGLEDRDALLVRAAGVIRITVERRGRGAPVRQGDVGAVAREDDRDRLVESARAGHDGGRRELGAAVDVRAGLEGHDRRRGGLVDLEGLAVVAAGVVGIAGERVAGRCCAGVRVVGVHGSGAQAESARAGHEDRARLLGGAVVRDVRRAGHGRGRAGLVDLEGLAVAAAGVVGIAEERVAGRGRAGIRCCRCTTGQGSG